MSIIWSLQEVKDRAHAYQFIKKLENRVLAFSPVVQQLYSNFEVLPTDKSYQRLVVLPRTNMQNTVFSNVVKRAVAATPYFIVPRNEDYDADVCIGVFSKDGNIKKGSFAKILPQMLEKHPNMVPIINTRFIKQLGERLPIIPIAFLDLSQLFGLSDFNRKSIRAQVEQKALDAA